MVSILNLTASKIFSQIIKLIKIQEIFQGTFKLISIMRQVLYLRRQIIEHPNPRIIQGDQKISVHLMITIQKVTSNVQSAPHKSPDIY